MRYVLAILLPPTAIFACGKWVQGVLNLVFWIISIPLLLVMGLGAIVWLLCTIHALVVCSSSAADKRLDRVVSAIEKRPQSAAQA